MCLYANVGFNSGCTEQNIILSLEIKSSIGLESFPVTVNRLNDALQHIAAKKEGASIT